MQERNDQLATKAAPETISKIKIKICNSNANYFSSSESQ